MDKSITSEMHSLEKNFAQQLEKISQLEDFISLHGVKEKKVDRLRELQNKTSEQKLLLKEAERAVQEFKNLSIPKYEDLLYQMRRHQLSMLTIIEKLDEKCAKAVTFKKKSMECLAVNNSNRKLSPAKGFNESGQPINTPRMSLSCYIVSPFIRRIKPTSLQFVDFEATITLEQFSKIPPYMKGRDTIDDLQYYLDSVISKCFSIKYTLFHKQREFVRNQHDLTLWKLYHSQEHYFPSKKFITEGDISSYTKKLIDKKASSRIVMLRHIQIIQEIRKNSTVFYIWLQSA